MRSLPTLALAAIYVLVQVVALFLAPLFLPQFSAFPDPNSPVNPLIYVFMVLLMTAIILVLIKFGRQRIIQGIFYISISITLFYVFLPTLLAAGTALNVDPEGIYAIFASLALAGALMYLLIKKGEWYVIDAVGLIIAVGVTAILGMSLGILPAVILLVLMAVYDAISVYKTKHMITLAEGVTSMRLPVLFIVPKKRDFTMETIERKGIINKEGGEREAVFMGVGDAVIPGILVVSASIYLPATAVLFTTANILVALGTIAGGLLGYLLLMRFVMKGRPQAGLPFLNTGAILGYIVSFFLIFGTTGPSLIGL
jgi:presenilin-like A22 family membrane protease